jgi:hypothetical protein
VLDEPLYASFLSITGLSRPYRDLVLAAQVRRCCCRARALSPASAGAARLGSTVCEARHRRRATAATSSTPSLFTHTRARATTTTQDADAHAVASAILGPRRQPVLYAKHMAKHKVGLGQELWQRGTHMVSTGRGGSARSALGARL